MTDVLPLPQQISRIPGELGRHVGRVGVIDKLRELRKKYARVLAEMNTRFKCLHCGVDYYPRDNLVRRSCFMHPGRLLYGSSGVREWSCCGSDAGIIGCVSCMHAYRPAIKESIMRDPLHSVVEIPVEVFTYKLVDFNPAIIEDYPEGSASMEKDKPGNFYHIRRVVF